MKSALDWHRTVSRGGWARIALMVLGVLSAVPRGATAETEVTDADFSAEGLHYEDVLTHFYRGNFVEIPFDRDEAIFSVLFQAYLTTYASHCASSLPEDKKELTRSECAKEQVTTNGYGVEVSRTCIEWVDIPTGLFATPQMHHADAVLDALQAGDALRNAFGMITNENVMGEMEGLVANAQAADADMVALIKVHGCESPGLLRFQENLRLFALNKQPIRLSGDEVGKSAPTLRAEEQDLGRLAEDLVQSHSTTWVMNRYISGSVTGVQLVDQDQEGRPVEVTASYQYEGFTGRSRGSVRVTFADGVPECLYFHDFPVTCRTADRRVAAAFIGGDYKKS